MGQSRAVLQSTFSARSETKKETKREKRSRKVTTTKNSFLQIERYRSSPDDASLFSEEEEGGGDTCVGLRHGIQTGGIEAGWKRKKEKEGRLVLRLPSSGWLQLPYILLSFPNHSYLRKEGRSGGGWLEVEIEDAYNLDGPGIPTPPSLSLSFLPEREPRALSTRTCTRDGHFGKRKKNPTAIIFWKKISSGHVEIFSTESTLLFSFKNLSNTHTREQNGWGYAESVWLLLRLAALDGVEIAGPTCCALYQGGLHFLNETKKMKKEKEIPMRNIPDMQRHTQPPQGENITQNKKKRRRGLASSAVGGAASQQGIPPLSGWYFPFFFPPPPCFFFSTSK